MTNSISNTEHQEQSFDVIRLTKAAAAINKVISGESQGQSARKQLVRAAENAMAAAANVTTSVGFATNTAMFDGLYDLPEIPMMGFTRADGQPLLYGGGMTSITAEPGSGKSLVSTWACVQMARDGLGVLYLDFESTKSTMQVRLAQMGCGPDDSAAANFHYVDMETLSSAMSSVGSFASAIAATLNSTGASVVVLDGLAVALSSLGLSENDNAEVSEFLRQMLNTLQDRDDRSFVVIDHISKPQEGQSTKGKRYARGASAKLAMVTCGLMAEVASAPARGKGGVIHWTIAKDRNGVLGAQNQRAATIRINPVDRTGIEGGFEVIIDTPEGGASPAGRPLFLDGVAKKIMKLLANGPANKGVLREGMNKGSWEKYGVETMATLIEFGFVDEKPGRGPEKIYTALAELGQEDIDKIESDLQARKDGKAESPF